MRSFVAFRMTAQVSACWMLLCMFPAYSACWQTFAFFTALTLLGSFAASGFSSPVLRLLFGALPFLALLCQDGDQTVTVMTALVAAYVAGILTSGSFSADLRAYRTEVRILLGVSGVILFVASVSRMASKYECPVAAAFAFSTVFFAVLALRMRRFAHSASALWRLSNVGTFCGLSLLAAMGGALLWRSGEIAAFLIGKIAEAFSRLLLLGVKGYTSLLKLLNYGEISDSQTERPFTPSGWEDGIQEAAPILQDTTVDLKPLKANLPWGTIGLIVFGIVVVLITVWFFLHNRKEKKKARFLDDGKNVSAVRKKGGRRSRRRKAAVPSNAERMRELYRAYLGFLANHQILVKKSDTTAEITHAAAGLLLETDEQLRQLYRKARYSQNDLTDEELAHAKTLFGRLVSDENLLNHLSVAAHTETDVQAYHTAAPAAPVQKV